MFLVGGGILTPRHRRRCTTRSQALAARFGSVAGAVVPLLADAVVGIVAGALVLGAVSLARRLFGARAAA